MSDREQFEEWIAENRPDAELYRRDAKGSTRFGEYCKSSVQESWEVWQASRRAALEEAAERIEAMNDSAGDRASYDNREMYESEVDCMRALSAAADAIRALSKDQTK